MTLPVALLASDNAGKFKEFSQLLAGVCELKSQSEFHLKTPPETGASFEENAIIKGQYVCQATELPALADDSGLIVDGLEGAPGILSARYAGSNASDADNLKKLLHDIALLDGDALKARFYCAIAYVEPKTEDQPLIASGVWEGELVHKPVGSNGFGYDPIFYVADRHCTAAELEPAEKNRISHRAKALHDLRSLLKRHWEQERGLGKGLGKGAGSG